MTNVSNLLQVTEGRDWVSRDELLTAVGGKTGSMSSAKWNLESTYGIKMVVDTRAGVKGYAITRGERTNSKTQPKSKKGQVNFQLKSVTVTQENNLPALGSQLKVYVLGIDDNGKHFVILHDDTGKAWTVAITDFAGKA